MNDVVELWKSLKIQTRVIYALMMREIITRYGRKGLGFLWLFLEPALFTGAIAFLWQYVRFRLAARAELSVAAFVLTGWISGKLWMLTVGKTMAAVEANKALFYHRNIKPIDLMLSRIILELAGVTGAFIVVSAFFIFLGIITPPVNYSCLVLGWYLMAWFAFDLAIFVASLDLMTDVVRKIWPIFSITLFISSGTFYLVQWLPDAVKPYALLLPTVHNIEMIRYGYWGPIFTPYFNISYSVLFNLFFMLIALTTQRISIRKLEIE